MFDTETGGKRGRRFERRGGLRSLLLAAASIPLFGRLLRSYAEKVGTYHEREIPKEDAIKIVNEAATYGLVNNILVTAKPARVPKFNGKGMEIEALCNCGPWCSSFRGLMLGITAARKLGSTGVDKPLERAGIEQYIGYAAHINEQDCTGCGSCAKICPFDAIHAKKVDVKLNGRTIQQIRYEVLEDLCQGCGVCSNVLAKHEEKSAIVETLCKNRALSYSNKPLEKLAVET